MHVLFGEMNQAQLIVMTILMIISSLIGHVLLEQVSRKDHLLVSPAVLTGIWLTAGLAMGVPTDQQVVQDGGVFKQLDVLKSTHNA